MARALSAAWTVRPSLLPNPLYPDIWIAERGLEALQSMPSDQPWLLWISFVGPHEPFDTPTPWRGFHPASHLPPATPRPDWIKALPDSCELKRCAQSWSGLLSPQQIKACRADYADHLHLLDDQLGLLCGLSPAKIGKELRCWSQPITGRCLEMETCSTRAAFWKGDPSALHLQITAPSTSNTGSFKQPSTSTNRAASPSAPQFAVRRRRSNRFGAGHANNREQWWSLETSACTSADLANSAWMLRDTTYGPHTLARILKSNTIESLKSTVPSPAGCTCSSGLPLNSNVVHHLPGSGGGSPILSRRFVFG